MRKTIICVCALAVSLAMTLGTVKSLAQSNPVDQRAAKAVHPPGNLSVAELEKEGDALREKKAYEEALSYYRAAQRKDKSNAVLYNKAGIAQLQLRELREAEKSFARAVKKNKQYAAAYNNLGVAAYLQGAYQKATQQYEKAIALQETSASFHSNLGTAWFAQGKIEKALVEYNRAVEIDPEILTRVTSGGAEARVSTPQERAYYFYVLAKMYAARKDVERCLHCLRKAKEDNYSRIGDVYKDADFETVRADPRFAELMSSKPE
ncbi:MAG: tetratricopeptide repeat protein [Acidobacteriia bacterium]|nr:tetratricopeptide repeat protein [Terriglobia bacterium]